MGEFRFGTSSWSEKSWAGVFYPSGTPPSEYLSHYSTQFNTVEADVTYYRIPDRRMVEAWQRKTPEGFVLSAKFPRSIVHGGDEATPDADKLLVPDVVWPDVERFLDMMQILGPKCGPLVLQFPYFNKKVFPAIEPFLDRLEPFLSKLPTEFRYGVEVRNRTWIGKPLLDLLRTHRVALMLVDLPYMPHPSDLVDKVPDLLTTDFAYIRLIGDRKAVEEKTKTFDKIVVDQRPRLEKWAVVIRFLLPRVTKVFTYANNHFAGYGPETIRELAALVSR